MSACFTITMPANIKEILRERVREIKRERESIDSEEIRYRIDFYVDYFSFAFKILSDKDGLVYVSNVNIILRSENVRNYY